VLAGPGIVATLLGAVVSSLLHGFTTARAPEHSPAQTPWRVSLV
jgi:hypothetical protein